MTDNIEYPKKPGNGKVLAGLILLAVGGVLLLRQFDFPYFPNWLISWPMLLIAWGLYAGAKHNWRNPAWFILILIGLAWLLDRNVPGLQAHQIVWPVIIISFGLWLILRRNHRWDKDKSANKWDWRKPQETGLPDDPNNPEPAPAHFNPHSLGDDYLDTVSVFGGVKKTILSKDFKGGDIVNIFGGAELDFIQADISGRVIIDITQVFGGTKIIVPSNWQVVSDIAAVFASVDDKRLKNTAGLNNDKILVLKGVSIFAGIEVRSY